MPDDTGSSAAEVLGITKEAFDAATNAMESVVGGGLEPDEPANEQAKGDSEEKNDGEEKKGSPEGVKKEEPVSPAWAAVKKAEQQNTQERAALRRELIEAKKLRERLEAREKSQLDIIAELKKDPTALEKHGLPLNEFLDRIINGNQATPQTAKREASEENSSLRQEIKELKQLFMQRETRTAEQDFTQRFEGVLQKPEYELLREYPDAKQAAFNFAAAYYQQHGKMDLTHEQIARHLQDTWQEHINSLRSTKAVRKALGLPDDNAEPEPKAPSRNNAAPKAKPRTITSNMAASPARGDQTPRNRQTVQSDEDILREAEKLVPKDVWEQLG